MHRANDRRQRGLSLLEVALAIAVIAFALVGLLALLPTGLRTLSESVDDSRAAQIAGQVTALLRPQPSGQRQLFGQRAAASPGGEMTLAADENGILGPADDAAPYRVALRFFPRPDLAPDVLQMRIGVFKRGTPRGTEFQTFLGGQP